MSEQTSAGRHRASPASPPAHEKQAEASPKAAKKHKRLNPWLRFLIKLTLVVGIVAAVFHFVLGVHIQRGNRMYPAIRDGDLLIAYKLDPYHTGDAVLYRVPETGELAVSRIVAIGDSEIVLTESGEVQIDNYIHTEQVFYPTHPMVGSSVSFPYQMSDHAYFLLDDYRVIGRDSRIFGEIHEEDILGKIVYVLRRRGI